MEKTNLKKNRGSLLMKSLFLCFSLFILFGCSTALLPSAQKGGTVKISRTRTVISQPANSKEPTTFSFAMTNTAESTNVSIQTSLGTHQEDVARKAWGEVQMVAEKVKHLKILYWFGAFFMLLGILMAIAQKYIQVGIKVVLGSIFLGVVLCLIPSAMVDTTSRLGIFAVIGLYLFVLGKSFTSTNKQ